VININHKVNVIGLLFSQDELNEIVERLAKKYNIPIDLKDLKR
jgi:hypothetical protein